MTTRVVEFNDLEALERELADGEVAALLIEPALTNVGIVPARARLPRRASASSPAGRHAADHRRDPHDLRRPGRLHRRATASSPTCS